VTGVDFGYLLISPSDNHNPPPAPLSYARSSFHAFPTIPRTTSCSVACPRPAFQQLKKIVLHGFSQTVQYLLEHGLYWSSVALHILVGGGFPPGSPPPKPVACRCSLAATLPHDE